MRLSIPIMLNILLVIVFYAADKYTKFRLLLSDVGVLIYLIAAFVFAAVLAPFFVCLRKTTEEAKKQRFVEICF